MVPLRALFLAGLVIGGLVIGGVALPAAASAGTVTIDVRGPDGQPLADAVVVVEQPGAARPVPRGPYVMEQKAIAFHPHVLVVPVGAIVAFPNRDPVRHHVYSFSPAKKFDLKLYGSDDQRTVTFDRAGVVALGCNIHDAMSGFVFVTASPYAVKTDGAGRAVIADVPAGAATVRIWSPAIRGSGNSLAQSATIGAGGFAATYTIHR